MDPLKRLSESHIYESMYDVCKENRLSTCKISVGKIDSLAAGGLGKLQDKYPILSKSTDEWAQGPRKMYEMSVQPTVDKVAAARKYSVDTVASVTQNTARKVSNSNPGLTNIGAPEGGGSEYTFTGHFEPLES